MTTEDQLRLLYDPDVEYFVQPFAAHSDHPAFFRFGQVIAAEDFMAATKDRETALREYYLVLASFQIPARVFQVNEPMRTEPVDVRSVWPIPEALFRRVAQANFDLVHAPEGVIDWLQGVIDEAKKHM